MTVAVLKEQSEIFANDLSQLFEIVLDSEPKFEILFFKDQDKAIIGPGPFKNNKPSNILLPRECDGESTPLELGINFTVEMDNRNEYMQVCTSAFGLWIDVTHGERKAKPIVRVEYDRHPIKRERASAHVHLHANSPELAWAYGSCGQTAPNLHDLHFPVGGRRFRPSIEEFLLFLHRENIFTNYKACWKQEVLKSLEVWEERQARATARQFPEEVKKELERLGYTITNPFSATE